MTELLTAIEATAFSIWVRESTSIWGYPTILTLHTVGLAMVVGLNTMVDLRVLGFGRGIPVASLEKLFPWMWVGFWVNAATGVMLLIADTSLGLTTIFMYKLGIVAFGVALMVMVRRTVYGARGQAPTISTAARAYAALSLAIWIAAIATGRFMAYIGEPI